MSTEDTEWELLEKRLEHAKTPVATPMKRATIKADEDVIEQILDLARGKRDKITINTHIIDGMLRTDEKIEINIILTDGEKD